MFAFCYLSSRHAPASPLGCAQYAPPCDDAGARAPRRLHLNPLRARVAPDLRALDRYPWTGHSALLGTVARPWQSMREILARFGAKVGRARRAYRDFVTAGVPLGHRPEFQGGGLLRSHGGWAAVAALRRGREAYLADERILGSSECRTGGGRPTGRGHPLGLQGRPTRPRHVPPVGSTGPSGKRIMQQLPLYSR